MGWTESDDCRPGTPLYFDFSTSLDAKLFDPKILTIEPATPGLEIRAQDDTIVVDGAKKPNTTYKVTIAGSLRDVFDQTLGTAASHTFAVGPVVPAIHGPERMFIVDPLTDKPTIDVFTVAHTGLAVKLYKVRPADFPRYRTWQENNDAAKPTLPPGTKVVDATVPIARSQATSSSARARVR